MASLKSELNKLRTTDIPAAEAEVRRLNARAGELESSIQAHASAAGSREHKFYELVRAAVLASQDRRLTDARKTFSAESDERSQVSTLMLAMLRVMDSSTRSIHILGLRNMTEIRDLHCEHLGPILAALRAAKMVEALLQGQNILTAEGKNAARRLFAARKSPVRKQ